MNDFLHANRGVVFASSGGASGLSSGDVDNQQAHTNQMDEMGSKDLQKSKDENSFASLMKDEINNQTAF